MRWSNTLIFGRDPDQWFRGLSRNRSDCGYVWAFRVSLRGDLFKLDQVRMRHLPMLMDVILNSLTIDSSHWWQIFSMRPFCMSRTSSLGGACWYLRSVSFPSQWRWIRRSHSTTLFPQRRWSLMIVWQVLRWSRQCQTSILLMSILVNATAFSYNYYSLITRGW